MLDHSQLANNAIDPEMFSSLGRAYKPLEDDADLFVGVLHGFGPSFGGALDGSAFYSALANGDFALDGPGRINPLGTSNPRLSKPVIAAAHGTVLSMGHELMLATSFAIAAEDATFEQSEVTRATYPSGGSTVRFPRLAGGAAALRWILTGERWDAYQALRMGLIQEVVPVGNHLERAVALAERIARNAPLGVRAAIASTRQAEVDGDEAAYNELLPRLEQLTRSRDFEERLRAARSGRSPVFTGR